MFDYFLCSLLLTYTYLFFGTPGRIMLERLKCCMSCQTQSPYIPNIAMEATLSYPITMPCIGGWVVTWLRL